MDKLNALAKYLDVSPDEIQVDDGYGNKGRYKEYKTCYGTYLVMNEKESKEAVYEDIENLIDDMGIYDLFTPEYISWIEENAIDQKWFEDWFVDNYISYANDIELELDDEYGNRLNRECIEHNIITPEEIVDNQYTGEKDLYEELADKIVLDIKNSNTEFSQEFVWQFGRETLTEVLKTHPHIIDLQAVVNECIALDGYGHNLSSYDGETIELDDDLFAYKQSDYDERDN